MDIGDLLIELFFELIFEGGLGVAANKKIHKAVRYPIAILILLFMLSILALIAFVGIKAIAESGGAFETVGGIVLIAFDIFLIVLGVLTTRLSIKEKMQNQNRQLNEKNKE